MSDLEINDSLCVVCGKVVGATEWLILNRYGVGTGSGRVMRSALDSDGEYLWNLDPAVDGDDFASGRIMHWPLCANQFIEGVLAETRFELGRLP